MEENFTEQRWSKRKKSTTGNKAGIVNVNTKFIYAMRQYKGGGTGVANSLEHLPLW